MTPEDFDKLAESRLQGVAKNKELEDWLRLGLRNLEVQLSMIAMSMLAFGATHLSKARSIETELHGILERYAEEIASTINKLEVYDQRKKFLRGKR